MSSVLKTLKTVARYILICAMAIDGHLAIINLGEFGGLDFFQIPKCMHETAQGNGITNNSIDIYIWIPEKEETTLKNFWRHDAVRKLLPAWGVYTSKGKPGYYKGRASSSLLFSRKICASANKWAEKNLVVWVSFFLAGGEILPPKNWFLVVQIMN